MQNEALIFKALSDEIRLKILALLLEDELCVCEITTALELPQSTASRHLAYLRKSGWIADRRQGLWTYYRLNEEGHPLIRELTGVLGAHLKADSGSEVSLARLQAYRKDQNRKAC